jgi:hypothetical protein
MQTSSHHLDRRVFVKAVAALSALPLTGRVRFAGEHPSLWIAWMNGAFEPAERVVGEILRAGGQPRRPAGLLPSARRQAAGWFGGSDAAAG